MKTLQTLVCWMTNPKLLKTLALITVASAIGFCIFGAAGTFFKRPDLEQMGMYIGIPVGIYFVLGTMFGGALILDEVEREKNLTTPMWLVKSMAALLSFVPCAFVWARIAEMVDLPSGPWHVLILIPAGFLYASVMKGILKKPAGFVRKYSCAS